MRRTTLILIAGSLASVAIAASAFFLYGRPNYVRIAVTRDTSDHHLLLAAGQMLTRERAGIRFRLVTVNDPAASSKALDTGNVEFAISRSDTALPINGKTAVVMHSSAAILVAPAKSAISKVSQLRRRRIGVLEDSFRIPNRAILEQIFAHYNLRIDEVTLIPMRIEAISAAIRSGTIDAMYFVGPITSGRISDAINAIASGSDSEPVFIPIEQAQAISQISSAFDKTTIVSGAFGGAKSRPDQEVGTVSVSVRLFASNNASNQLVANTTRTLFELKSKLTATHPLALQMHAPDTSRDAKMPTHPGAVAYLDNEEVSLFDRFSDLFYLSAMVLSVLGSAAAAIASHFTSDDRKNQGGRVRRLTEILTAARRAPDTNALEALQYETDEILTEVMLRFSTEKGAVPNLDAISLLIGQIHNAIRDRRHILDGEVAISSPGANRPRQISAIASSKQFPTG